MRIRKIVVLLITAILLAQTWGGLPAKAGTGAAETRRATGFLKDVAYQTYTNYETVTLTINNYSDYSAMRLSNPDRIVIDVFNAAITGKARTIKADGKLVQNVRIGQFDTYTARIVLDVEGQPDYSLAKTSGGLKVYVGDVPGDAMKENGSTGSDDEPEAVGSDGSDSIVNHGKKQKLTIQKAFYIDYSPSATNDDVTIGLASYKGYKVTRLTGPDRLQIDIPKVKYQGKARTAAIGSPFIKTLRYSVLGKDTARIVLDLTAQNQYVVKETKGKLIISFKAASYKNISYHNNGDRVYFLLSGAQLTDGGEAQKPFYSGSLDNTGKTYTITFPSAKANLGDGIFRINDEYVESVTISKNTTTQMTSVKFKTAKKLTYEIFTRDKSSGTAVTLLEPAKKSDKLVVIDAGHGGWATGAIYSGLYEKNLNLDIAKRLNELLKKKKINTYMIREDDSYVGNYERAFIANQLNASLFLSIHNNAIDDPDFSGTMTLYYPQASWSTGFTGKSFAEIIHRNLLSRLGTVNRKTVERPNLVVLNATAMPSALAEVAYMTNAGDRSNLQKAAFRQKAAQGLCDAVVQALSKLK